MEQLSEPEKCPSCKLVGINDRQESRPHLCRWCGYNHETGQDAGFVTSYDPFEHLFDDLPETSPPKP